MGTEGERIKAEKEAPFVQRILDPLKPTEKEVEMHSLTHLPFRNWCPHCVRAKGKDVDHRKVGDKQRGLPEFAFDYCFQGKSWAAS